MQQENSDLIVYNGAEDPFATEFAPESGHKYTSFDAAPLARSSQPLSEMLRRSDEDVHSQTSEAIRSGQISQTSCNILPCPGTLSIVCRQGV
jgi:hypothetical protein